MRNIVENIVGLQFLMLGKEHEDDQQDILIRIRIMAMLFFFDFISFLVARLPNSRILFAWLLFGFSLNDRIYDVRVSGRSLKLIIFGGIVTQLSVSAVFHYAVLSKFFCPPQNIVRKLINNSFSYDNCDNSYGRICYYLDNCKHCLFPVKIGDQISRIKQIKRGIKREGAHAEKLKFNLAWINLCPATHRAFLNRRRKAISWFPCM